MSSVKKRTLSPSRVFQLGPQLLMSLAPGPIPFAMKLQDRHYFSESNNFSEFTSTQMEEANSRSPFFN